MKYSFPCVLAASIMTTPLCAQEFTAPDPASTPKPQATVDYNQHSGSYVDLGLGIIHGNAQQSDSLKYHSINTGFGGNASVGQYFNPNLSYELTLATGRLSAKHEDDNIPYKTEVDTYLVGPALKATIPLGNRFAFTAKLGVGYLHMNGTDTNENTKAVDDGTQGSALIPFDAIGFNVAINHQWEVGMN